MKSTNALWVGLSALLITACGSPKDANEKNFSSAINEYLATQCPIAYVAAEFPTVVAADSPKQRPRWAIASVSQADSISLSPSRSHCTVAPAIKILPSSA